MATHAAVAKDEPLAAKHLKLDRVAPVAVLLDLLLGGEAQSSSLRHDHRTRW
jgi:hypothetical protein